MKTPIILSVGAGVVGMLATLVVLFLMSVRRSDLQVSASILILFAPTTSLLAVVVTWFCIGRKREQTDATSSVFSGATLAGGLNVPLVTSSIGLFSTPDWGVFIVALMMSAFVGIALGCPFGFAFGAACLRPIRLGARQPRSFDAFDAVARTCWRWLAMVNGCCALLIGGAIVIFGGRQEGAWILIDACVCMVAIGLIMGAHHKRKLELWKRWLNQVLAGHQPGWTVVSIDRVGRQSVETLPLLLLEDETACGSILVRHRTPRGEGGAYRSGELLEPVALVSEFR